MMVKGKNVLIDHVDDALNRPRLHLVIIDRPLPALDDDFGFIQDSRGLSRCNISRPVFVDTYVCEVSCGRC